LDSVNRQSSAKIVTIKRVSDNHNTLKTEPTKWKQTSVDALPHKKGKRTQRCHSLHIHSNII